MKTYKGTNKNLKCRDFQYEIGKEYLIDGKPVKCTNSGFHSCENPFDVFGYYPPTDSRYFISEADGEIDKEENSDSKVASSKITLKAEVTLFDFLKLGVEYIKDRVDWKNTNQSDEEKSAATNTGDYSAATNTGNRSAATNTGNRSAATNTGDYSAATNTGFQSAATVEGKQSFACGLGIENKAKACLDSWIVLSEWKEADGNWIIVDCKTGKIDGVTLKPDTFYQLVGGKFIEVE